MWIAMTRPVSPLLAGCDLEFLERRPIDPDRAADQHSAYEAALEALGATVVRAPAEPELPDSVFVEDPVVVLDEIAVVTAMRSPVRAREAASLASAIAPYRRLHSLEPPGRLEGGDVLRVGKDLFVGRSTRSDPEGIARLRAAVEPYGYSVRPVDVHGCLHLKTACCSLGNGALLLNSAWIDPGPLGGFDRIEVPPAEPFGANVIALDGAVLAAASSPATADLLVRRGWPVRTVDVSEFTKAEAGLTCMSVLFRA